MKTFFPPFIAFIVFAVIIALQVWWGRAFVVGDMGKGNLHAFMACFYFCWPLYFVTALLTQGLIMVPVWEGKDGARGALGKFNVFIFTSVICLLAALALAFCIWDRPTGRGHLIGMTLNLYLIQMTYWMMNFFVMLLFGDAGKPAPAVAEAQ